MNPHSECWVCRGEPDDCRCPKRESATCDAAVPTEWLPRFIGHHIWCKPRSVPQIESSRFAPLLEVFEEVATAHEQGSWWLRQAVVDWDGEQHVVGLAENTYVHAVPAAECAEMPVENGIHHKWVPPFDDPPEWGMRPYGWKPADRKPAEAPEHGVVETPSGDQFELF